MKRLIVILVLILAGLIMFYFGIYNYENPTSISNKKITGSATGESFVSFRILSDCNIPVMEGWNLISICSNMTNKSIQNALRDIAGSYQYVLEWNESSQDFRVFSINSVINPFSELAEDMSYFIYLIPGSNSSINPSGQLFDYMEIPLAFGWNTPTYPFDSGVDITKYLDTLNNSYRYVMVWNTSSQKFLIYTPLAVYNEFYNISAGDGQFIYINDSGGAILKYNRSILS